jgi:hypothetical protein
VDEVALGQVFLRVLRSSPVGIIPQIIHTDLHLQAALNRKPQAGEAWEPYKALLFGSLGELDGKILSLFQ